jgi:hypothetical protein
MPETDKNPIDKVRQLQRKLYVCAKQSRIRRFHALYDRIYRSDVLWEAWRRVSNNGGAAWVDAETIRAIEQRGPVKYLVLRLEFSIQPAWMNVAAPATQFEPNPLEAQVVPTIAHR